MARFKKLIKTPVKSMLKTSILLPRKSIPPSLVKWIINKWLIRFNLKYDIPKPIRNITADIIEVFRMYLFLEMNIFGIRYHCNSKAMIWKAVVLVPRI